MGRRMVGCIGAAALVVSVAGLTAVPVAAQTRTVKPRTYSPPRTPWGDPDIAGAFTNNDESLIPFERPAQFEGRRLEDITPAELEQLRDQRSDQREEADRNRAEFRSPIHWFENFFPQNSRAWLVTDPPDGKVPPQTDEARQRAAARAQARAGRGPADSYEDRSLYDRCISRGIAGSILPVIYNNGNEIVQAPGVVAIRNEMIHETRIVPLDGRPHPGPHIKMWMGDSRGHWDGDTLVVETKNIGSFAPGIGVNGGGTRHSNDITITERFTRIGADVILYEMHVDDPKTWTRPWTMQYPLKRDDNYGYFEYACHEGNYSLFNILSGARADEKAAADAAIK